MHNLIVGVSGSGKTNLAKRFAQNFEQLVVYDPLKSTGWPVGCAKYSSAEKFLAARASFRNCAIFIDEAKTLWDYDEREADKFLYLQRHNGCLIFLIAQRAKMVRPNARNQCSTVYAFRQSVDDAKALADEYSPDVFQCTKFMPGQFIASNGFSSRYYQLNYGSYPPTIDTASRM